MDEREQQRKVRHRLAVLRHAEEVTGNVALTCRYYGISRPTFYKWLHRYEELGEAGLRDGSSRPHRSPNETPTEIVGKIMYLRRHYHFGPRKIAMYLRRYHDIEISPSGVWRILDRLDMNRLPASQRYKRHVDRWKRYEKPLPGHRVQVDVKFVGPIGAKRKKHYQFTAIDDCTRIRVLRVYDRNNQKTATQFIDYVLEKLPFRVECIQTDNGAEFQGAFHWHVSTAASATSTSSPQRQGSTARSNDRIASTKKSSTGCSTASSSTTPNSSTTSSKNGSTSATSTAHTAASMDRPRTNGYYTRPRPPRKRPPSLTQLAER